MIADRHLGEIRSPPDRPRGAMSIFSSSRTGRVLSVAMGQLDGRAIIASGRTDATVQIVW